MGVRYTKVGVELQKARRCVPRVIDPARTETVEDQNSQRMRLSVDRNRLRCPLTAFHIAPQAKERECY